MRALVLGGTSFVGRAVVEELLRRGADVTLFSRGRTGADLFPGAERLVGDRDSGDVEALASGGPAGGWDVTVDVSGYVPRHVQQASAALLPRCERYLLISTGSVYDKDGGRPGMAEDSPRLAPRRDVEDTRTATTTEAYGPLKVACEDDALGLWGDRATIVRPGVVAGPHDPTDRFTYWVRRAARGGRVAVPGRLEQPVQVVDSEDLARLVVQLLQDRRPGTFNAVGPAAPVDLAGVVRACAEAAGTAVEPVAVGPVDADGTTRPGFPLVLPDASWDVMFRRSSAAARAVGLTGTPLVETAAKVLRWDRERGLPPLDVALTEAEESALLAAAGTQG